jgi:hypothetical protein
MMHARTSRTFQVYIKYIGQVKKKLFPGHQRFSDCTAFTKTFAHLDLVRKGFCSQKTFASRSGRGDGIAPVTPPTPPDMPFSASGG